MPEGRAEPRGRSAAKSMDGTEHSARLKDVMAGRARAWSEPCPDPARNSVQTDVVTRSEPAAGCHRDRRPNRRSERRVPDARSRRCPLRHRQASRGVNDPIRSGRGATPRARRRGRSHHGLLIDLRRRGCLTGGTERRPIAAMLQTSTCRNVWLAHITRAVRWTVRCGTRATWTKGSGQPTRFLGCLPPGATSQPPMGHRRRGVSCKYWCGSSANSTRPHPRCRWSRRIGH